MNKFLDIKSLNEKLINLKTVNDNIPETFSTNDKIKYFDLFMNEM